MRNIRFPKAHSVHRLPLLHRRLPKTDSDSGYFLVHEQQKAFQRLEQRLVLRKAYRKRRKGIKLYKVRKMRKILPAAPWNKRAFRAVRLGIWKENRLSKWWKAKSGSCLSTVLKQLPFFYNMVLIQCSKAKEAFLCWSRTIFERRTLPRIHHNCFALCCNIFLFFASFAHKSVDYRKKRWYNKL